MKYGGIQKTGKDEIHFKYLQKNSQLQKHSQKCNKKKKKSFQIQFEKELKSL